MVTRTNLVCGTAFRKLRRTTFASFGIDGLQTPRIGGADHGEDRQQVACAGGLASRDHRDAESSHCWELAAMLDCLTLQTGIMVAVFQVLSTSAFTAARIAGLRISDIANALFPASLMEAPKCQQRLPPPVRTNLS